jgi:hypothetical protein
LFPGGKGGHITDPYLQFRAVAEASGISVSSHDLRRTFISIAKRIGIDPTDRNHTTLNVTEGYDQTDPKERREPVQQVCDKLIELCGIAKPAGGNVVRVG